MSSPASPASPVILVIGATGAQGGAVARALLRNNWVVRALVRDTTSTASQALKSQGASLIQGNWDDLPAIQTAATGCTGLFLNLVPSFVDPSAELRYAQNILAAATSARIKHVVYSSAIGVDRYETLVNPDPQSFLHYYFRTKRAIEEEVRCWETWTILRGATFMSNFLLPVASFMFPELTAEGKFVSAYAPDTKVLLVDPEDIGSFGCAALSDPQKFGGKGVNLAAEALGVQQMATLMEKVSGKRVDVKLRGEEEVEAQKGANPIIASQVALRNMQTWMDVEEVRAWGIPMSTFEQYLEKEKERLKSTIGGST